MVQIASRAEGLLVFSTVSSTPVCSCGHGAGTPLRIIVAAEKPLDGELLLITPEGRVAAKSRGRQGEAPYF